MPGSFLGVFLSVITISSCEQVIGTFNQMLDPGRLTWWKTQWCGSPVELSKTNLAATGVSVTFNFNPATSLTNGFLEATFPTGFTIVSANGQTVTGQVVSISSSYQGGVDTSVTVTGVTLPDKEGAYGPIALRSRMSVSGQVIDANLNFAMVYITPKEAALTDAKVAYVVSTANFVKNTNVDLTFTLKLTQNLWRNDLIKLKIDPRFTLNLSNKNCTSMDRTSAINYYNGTHIDQPHMLDCVVSSKVVGQSQELWIYGLGVDIQMRADTNVLVLLISGFTNPDCDYDTDSYSWTIETLRFGTHHSLEKLSFSGPETAPAVLTTVTWKSTWGLQANSIVNQLQFYTDFSFITLNAIPAGGSITITLSERVVGNCYVLNDLGPVTCTSSSSILVAGFNAIPPGTNIALRFQIQVASSAGAKATAGVVTKDKAGKQIDACSGISPFTVASSTSASLISLSVLIYDVTGSLSNKAGGNGSSTQSIMFKLQGLAASVTAGATMEISCPFGTGLDDFQFYVPDARTLAYQSTGGTDYRSSDGQVGGTPTATHGSEPKYKTGSITQIANQAYFNPGTLIFSAGSNHAGKPVLSFRLYSSLYLTLPRVVSNIATAYECRIRIIGSDSSKPILVGVGLFAITGQDLEATASYLCASGNLNGTPLKVQFRPDIVDLPGSSGNKMYFLEIGIKTDYVKWHGSGVGEGGAYPVDSNLSTGVTMTLSEKNVPSDVLFSHLVAGLGLVSASGSFIDIYFPVAGVSSLHELVLQTFFTLKTDQRQIKYITHVGKTTNTYTLGTNIDAGTNVPSMTLTSSNFINGASLGSSLSFKATLASTITGDTYFFLILPKGYTFTSLRDVQSSTPNGSSFAEKKYFSSPSATFPFPGVLVKATTAGAQVATNSVITVAGLIAPLGRQDGMVKFVHASIDGDVAQQCYARAEISLSSSTGSINRWQVSPTTIKGRGPGGVDISQTITVTLPHGINAGGRLDFSIDPNWQIISSFTTCVVSGLNNAVCSLQSGSSYSITGFDDFSKVESTTVTIYLQHLTAPIVNADTSFKFATNFGTYTATGEQIDVAETVNNGFVMVQKSLQAGNSVFGMVTMYPPNAGTSQNDLYMSFSLNYDLPKASELFISIGIPVLSVTDAKNQCWLSPLIYSACSLTNGGVKFTLGQPYLSLTPLEVFLRHSLITPADTPSTPYGLKVTATWAGTEIIKDSAVSTTIAPSGKISPIDLSGVVAVDPSNAGEVANYTLSFQLTIDLGTKDRLEIVWPDEFDPYLGDANEELTQDPGKFYLPCRSDVMGPVRCLVDHWVLVVQSFSDVVPKKTPISLYVWSIRTPSAITGNFRLYHYDGNSTLVEFANTLGKVILQPPASALLVRRVFASNDKLNSIANYTFQYYLPDSLNATAVLRIRLPPQYDLQIDKYACSGFFSNETTSAVVSKFDASNGACQQTSNTISVTPANLNTTSLLYANLTLVSLPTPEYGLPRFASTPTWDFDIQDQGVYTPMSDWVPKFELFVYQNATKSFSWRTYSQYYAGYLGFKQPLKTLRVNNYNPRDLSNRIVVFPGSQSQDLWITTANASSPLQLQWLHLTPSVSTGLAVTSRQNFTMQCSDWQMVFRVAASITMAPGRYYITWTKTEGLRNSNDSLQFADLPKTLVEIPAKVVEKYKFAVAEIPPIPLGMTSVPITVSVTNAPCSDVSVSIVPESSLITVSPSSLAFFPNVQKVNFTVTVDPTFDASLTPLLYLKYKLDGTDAAVYGVPPASKVSVTTKTMRTAGSIVKMGINNVLRTSATIAPVTDRVGIVYYQVSARGRPVPSFSALKAAVRVSSPTPSKIPSPGDTWASFQLTKYKTHVSSYIASGTILMVSTTATDEELVEGLWAATDYQVAGYLDVLSEDIEPELALEYFTTLPMAASSCFQLTFTGEILESRANETIAATANRMNADPLRLGNMTRIPNLETRRLQSTATTTSNSTSVTTEVASTTFRFVLLQDRSIEQPDPITQSNLSVQAQQDLVDDLNAKNMELSSFELLSPPAQIVPMWNKSMEISNFTETSVTIKLRSNVAGRECCVALQGVSASLLPEQVMLGYSYNWTKEISDCSPVNTTGPADVIYLIGMQPDTNYYIHCSASDDNPLWPTQMEYSATMPMPFIPIHTSLPMEMITAAEALTVGIAMIGLT